MKKKIIRTILLVIIVLFIIGVKFIPFGSKSYTNKQMASTLIIPRLSFFEKECCMFSTTFRSFRSVDSLQKELNKIMKKYEKKTCNNKTVYYDSKNKITIYEYGVENGLLFNTYYINYDNVTMTNDDCNEITDFKKIEYKYYHIPDNQERDSLSIHFKYLNENDKLYNVYTDCRDCLSLKKGMGYWETFENELSSSYISMNTLIEFLDYQVSNNKATKKYYSNKEIVLYKNDDFSLLKCNTASGNQDVYISDKLEYDESYCK